MASQSVDSQARAALWQPTIMAWSVIGPGAPARSARSMAACPFVMA